MKKNINIACGLFAVSLLAFALVACESENLSDSTGNIAEDTCRNDFVTRLDCKTNKPFVCKEGRWESLPEEYSWIHQKCDSCETAKYIDIEYQTEKGSVAKVSLSFYSDGIYWRQSFSSLPERRFCEIEDDKVTVSGKTYQCIGGRWEL